VPNRPKPLHQPRSKASAQAERRALKALSFMRQGLSRAKAADRARTTPRTIQKYARKAIRRREGTYHALPTDQMRRPMRVLTEQGVTVADVKSSRTASRLARYWGAVDYYLRTGDRARLRRYEGKRLRAGGHLFEFITDPDLLARLAEVGEVRFEDLYEATA
jgi:catechol 2,3-dioxygenase-like lactoylglutathione lyase family enzyme